MRALRQARYDTNDSLSVGFAGWMPGDGAHHCTWEGVKCSPSGHVITL